MFFTALQWLFFHPIIFIKSSFFWILRKIQFQKIGKYPKVFAFPLFKNTRNISFGDLLYLGKNLNFYAGKNGEIQIGDNVHFTGDSYISATERITIGNNVLVGEFVSIRDSDHGFLDVNIPISQQSMNASPIVIQDDVWIGRGVMIAKGVTIGKGSIVGANSFVNTNIPSMSIVVGSPGKVIKKRA